VRRDAQAAATATGRQIEVLTGLGFGDYIRKQFDETDRIIREANIKAE
jgi:hypothetical protein